MSSTGNVSGIISNPTTSMGEERRQSSIQTGSSATMNEKIIIERGIVREIHETDMLVRVKTNDGKTVANGQWVSLSYPNVEFTQNFGEIQVGDVVTVTSLGLGGHASAVIIGRSGEMPEKAVRLENKVKMGVGPFLFPPGIGVG